MSNAKLQKAIIIGSGVVSLGVINDLAADGVKVIHISPKKDDVALRSRWTDDKAILSANSDQADELIDLLDSRSSKWKGACVIPTTDPMLRIVSKNLDQVCKSYVTPVIPWQRLEPVVNKGQLYASAAEAGIPTPRIYYGQAIADVANWINDLEFPVIVKPSETPAFFSHFNAKVLRADNAQQLHRQLAEIKRLGLDVMVSEIIPGEQKDLKTYRCYIDQSGNVIAEMCNEKIRSHPPEFGVGIVQRTIPMHETLRAQGRTLLNSLDFTGFATVEFKYDSRDRTFKLMEINPRPAMIQRLFRAAGINFAKLTVDDLCGQALLPDYQYRPDVYAIHNTADLYHFRRFAKQGFSGLRDYFRPYFVRRKVLLLPPFRDPAPFIYDTQRVVRGWLKKRVQRADVQT